MITNLTKEDLIKFELDIASEFNNSNIRAPIHLYSNNEDKMIEIFHNIRHQDWVLCTWRSHYQHLLKGVPSELLKQKIIDGKSISLCFPEYRTFSSAIVAGIIPIGVGLALNSKINKLDEIIYVFIGDMAAMTGTFYENLVYSYNHKLPIRFIIEDNGKSVCTDTKVTWNNEDMSIFQNHPLITYYKYNLTFPHAGAGKRVQF